MHLAARVKLVMDFSLATGELTKGAIKLRVESYLRRNVNLLISKQNPSRIAFASKDCSIKTNQFNFCGAHTLTLSISNKPID